MIERLNTYYRQIKVQPYHLHPVAQRAVELMGQSCQRLADYLNLSNDEAHQGPSTSQRARRALCSKRRFNLFMMPLQSFRPRGNIGGNCHACAWSSSTVWLQWFVMLLCTAPQSSRRRPATIFLVLQQRVFGFGTGGVLMIALSTPGPVSGALHRQKLVEPMVTPMGCNRVLRLPQCR